MTETVLFVSPTGTMDNGAEISIFYLMKSMVEKGYRVLNAFPNYHVPIQEEYKSKMKEVGVEVFGLSASKWWWEEAPGGLPGTHYQRVQAYQKNIQDLREVIKNQKVDLVITNTVNVFQGAVAAAYENIRHFWLIHEFPEGEFGYYREKLDFIDHFSDEIFAVTGALAVELQSLFPHRTVHTFAPYTEIKTEEYLFQENKNHRVVSIGRITERKNQLELIKAFKDLPDLQLIFIGDCDLNYKERCNQYIIENRMKNVHFLGYQNNPWSEVSQSDIAVFPSSMETFGLVYIESILHGIPTILSDNRGHVSAYEYMGREGQLYPLGDIKTLKDLILEFIKDFKVKKMNSLHNLSLLQNRYSLPTVYQSIFEEIKNTKNIKIKNLENYMVFLQVNKTILDYIKEFLKSLLTLKKIR